MNEDGWFSDLYERNYALLYRIGRVFLGGGAREALIEDQIQEAFVRAWQKRDKLQNHPNPRRLDGGMLSEMPHERLPEASPGLAAQGFFHRGGKRAARCGCCARLP